MKKLLIIVCGALLVGCSKTKEPSNNLVAVKTSSEVVSDNPQQAPFVLDDYDFVVSDEDLEAIASKKMGSSFVLENKKVKHYANDESKLFIQVIGTIENGERTTLALPAHLEAGGLVLTP